MVLLVLALSTDALIASLAYGTNNIRITALPAAVISLVGSGFLVLSLVAAGVVRLFISPAVCVGISFGLLFFIGFASFFQGLFKNYLRRRRGQKQVRFEMQGVQFVLDIFLDETKADSDDSKDLSVRESLYLGLALSVDSLASGLGSGLTAINVPLTVAIYAAVQFLVVMGGFSLGKKLRGKAAPDLSWLGGLLLIILAFTRLF
ncbi:manganese efflux pump [Zongyangia hominis]|uniref:Manganese efflux pump n=1 Tax=Zongyangia hominis TaxID=2763677 RepID=A0A926EFY6_9FIRM|nr:manganese efflux pump [Zongyangia hominis]MBC8571121.1 manganese efflux pump [Zongyangia hominis]